MKIAYTICSANYLPFAKTVADSLVRHNPDYHFVIALADTYQSFDPKLFEPHRIVPVIDMNLPDLAELNQRYTIFELSCALKPSVALHLLQAYPDCDTLFYFDSDIVLYGDLSAAEAILRLQPLVLTPHLSALQPYHKSSETELSILRSGVYNAGFFGTNRSPDAVAFLEWWRERLRYHCFNNVSAGLFVDQLWLNLAPLYFPSAAVLFDPGYNLAYWNFWERTLCERSGTYWVNESHPLVFFHFSGYDLQQPDQISKHDRLHNFESQPVYRPLFDAYAEEVKRNDEGLYFSLPPTMGRPAYTAPKREKNFFKRKWKKWVTNRKQS